MSSPSLILQNLRPDIEHSLAITGTVGASVGVLHGGKTYSEHFGFRDHARTKAPNSDTLYNIGSLTKSMIAATVASLVAEGATQ